MGQVGHLGTLIGEDGPVHGGQLGQALQGVLGHVGVLPNLPVYLQRQRKNKSLMKEKTFHASCLLVLQEPAGENTL